MGKPVLAPSAAASDAPEEGAFVRRISTHVLVLVAFVVVGLAGEGSGGCCVAFAPGE
jgi:hypothetical protein